MTYQEALQYLNSFINYERIPRFNYSRLFKLERMREFLNSLGNPHSGLRAIHIAGSKGKGSICAMLAYILKEAGFKAGLYTSPHLIDFRERIRILSGFSGRFSGFSDPVSLRPGLKTKRSDLFEGMIGEKDLCILVERLQPFAENFRVHPSLGKLSFFELYTALAFLYFRERAVDFAVIETGLGGRLDATNVIEPLVCGISKISLEHTDKLGNTLRQIATEKSGIIKENVDVVSSPQEDEVLRVLKEVCKGRNSTLFLIGRDFKNKDIDLNLMGKHQIINAATALGIIERLNKGFSDPVSKRPGLKVSSRPGLKITEGAIKRGLKNVVWPGRLQTVPNEPSIVLDGAHCPASVSALSQAINENFKYRRLFLIFGISMDKDIKAVVNKLRGLNATVILTKAKDNPRAVKPDTLQEFFSSNNLIKTKDVKTALETAMRLANKEDLILVTGSLFVVGDALKYLTC